MDPGLQPRLLRVPPHELAHLDRIRDLRSGEDHHDSDRGARRNGDGGRDRLGTASRARAPGGALGSRDWRALLLDHDVRADSRRGKRGGDAARVLLRGRDGTLVCVLGRGRRAGGVRHPLREVSRGRIPPRSRALRDASRASLVGARARRRRRHAGVPRVARHVLSAEPRDHRESCRPPIDGHPRPASDHGVPVRRHQRDREHAAPLVDVLSHAGGRAPGEPVRVLDAGQCESAPAASGRWDRGVGVLVRLHVALLLGASVQRPALLRPGRAGAHRLCGGANRPASLSRRRFACALPAAGASTCRFSCGCMRPRSARSTA